MRPVNGTVRASSQFLWKLKVRGTAIVMSPLAAASAVCVHQLHIGAARERDEVVLALTIVVVSHVSMSLLVGASLLVGYRRLRQRTVEFNDVCVHMSHPGSSEEMPWCDVRSANIDIDAEGRTLAILLRNADGKKLYLMGLDGMEMLREQLKRNLQGDIPVVLRTRGWAWDNLYVFACAFWACTIVVALVFSLLYGQMW